MQFPVFFENRPVIDLPPDRCMTWCRPAPSIVVGVQVRELQRWPVIKPLRLIINVIVIWASCSNFEDK